MARNHNDTSLLLLDFARRWLPYDELPGEDVWVMFGISAEEFCRRLIHVVDLGGSRTTNPQMSVTEAAALRTFCVGRLDRYETSGGRCGPNNALNVGAPRRAGYAAST